MAKPSLFKLSVLALLLSTLAACGKTGMHRQRAAAGSAPVAEAAAGSGSAARRGLQRPAGSADC
jgi:iron uptake system component EfeO